MLGIQINRCDVKQNILETLLGVIVLLVTICGIIYLISNSQNRIAIDREIELKASFDQVNGLKSGSLVKISGITVGYVKSLQLAKNTFEADVGMIVDGDLNLPSDTEAVVEMDGIFGDTFVSLIPGGSAQILKSGDQLILTQGTSGILSLLSAFIK